MVDLPAADLLQDEIKNTRILIVNWKSYRQSQMISEEDFEFINAFDSEKNEINKQQILDRYGKNAAKALTNLIGQIARDQTVRYLLTMVDDILTMNKDNIMIFHEHAVTLGQQAWTPFVTLLSRPDKFICNQAARISAKLATFGKLRFSSAESDGYLSWIRGQLTPHNAEWLTATTSALMIMLRAQCYRKPIVEHGIVDQLMEVLATRNQGFQLQYQVVCCFWLISFTCADELFKKQIMVPVCDVLRQTEKQKVSRICLAVFRNLIENCNSDKARDICSSLIGCKAQKSIQVLTEKQLEDEEMEEDLKIVVAKLSEVEQNLSSFEEFCSEVNSGRLSWSPVHTNNKFWRENAQRLVEKDYKILRRLTHILETDQNTECLSVGCHDLGEFVTHYPRGRQVIDEISAKQTVMQLMAHQDQTVRYNALIAVQKMMVNNWAILGRQIGVN